VAEKKRDPFMGLDRQLLTGRRETVPPPQEPQPASPPPSEPALLQDNEIASDHDSTHDLILSQLQPDMVKTIRKAVRVRGNEQSIHRLTREEKRALKELVYNYDVAGTKTSENEITRIAINYLIIDHKQRGQESVLAQVLTAMNE